MKSIKSYPTTVEADIARMALEAAGIASVVVGIGVGMEGGTAGVQLLVPDDRIEEALTARYSSPSTNLFVETPAACVHAILQQGYFTRTRNSRELKPC